tara:strand:+ start:1199 stop:1993 length:795 start_codon:yes stop_codon:yes gene_type:complete
MLKKIINAIKYRFFKYLFILKDFIKNFKRIKKLDYKKEIFVTCDNLREFYTRANSCQKEPELIEWLEKNHKDKDDLFWDIGSNVGAYSMVAAKIGYNVMSFEPAFQNYFKLQENVTLNQLDKNISSFCISFGKKTSTGTFNIFDTSFGTSRGNFNLENYFQLNLPKIAEKKTLVFTIDHLINTFNLDEPTLIKIDVDGGEFDIIEGAEFLLTKSDILKSILVEFDEDKLSYTALESYLKKLNWKVVSKYNRHLGVNNLILKKID